MSEQSLDTHAHTITVRGAIYCRVSPMSDEDRAIVEAAIESALSEIADTHTHGAFRGSVTIDDPESL